MKEKDVEEDKVPIILLIFGLIVGLTGFISAIVFTIFALIKIFSN